MPSARFADSFTAYIERFILTDTAPLIIGILTVSDRASRGEYEDRGGPAIHAYLEGVLTCVWNPVAAMVADEVDLIAETISRMCDRDACSLVITTGGTGPARRDVTPEATERVCEKLLPGFGERMRAFSVDNVPTAILSRQIAGIRARSLVLNLPGNPRAIAECLDAVFPAIPDCVDLIGGPLITTNDSRFVPYRRQGA